MLALKRFIRLEAIYGITKKRDLNSLIKEKLLLRERNQINKGEYLQQLLNIHNFKNFKL